MQRSSVHRLFVIGVLLALLHGAMSAIYIGHPPHYDEMYHMLAAESWRSTGELRILDGEYNRAALFTKAVALNMTLCSASLECARAISVGASMFLVFLVTVFAGSVMQPGVGLISGLLLALNPAAIVASQMVRFYSLHALVFAAFAFLVFVLFLHWRRLSWWERAFFGAVGVVLFLLANHLQALTQVGMLGVILGVSVFSWPGVVGLVRRLKPLRSALLVTLAALLGILGVISLDPWSKIEALRSGPQWAEWVRAEHLYYYRRLRTWYPVLWPLFPFFAIITLFRWPRVSIFALAVFLSGFAILSVAAAKADRYILFVLPFLFIVTAGGIVTVARLITVFFEQRLRDASPVGWTQRKKAARASAWVLVLGLSVPYVVSQPTVLNSFRMVAGGEYVGLFGNYGMYADWRAAVGNLLRLVEVYPVVVASSGVKAAYFLGDFSFELNRHVLFETDTGEEFGVDWRTGRRVISTGESLARIVEECGPTLVIVEPEHFSEDEALEVLPELGSEVNVAPNMSVWTMRKVDNRLGEPGVVRPDRDALNCRPIKAPRGHS